MLFELVYLTWKMRNDGIKTLFLVQVSERRRDNPEMGGMEQGLVYLEKVMMSRGIRAMIKWLSGIRSKLVVASHVEGTCILG